MAGWSRRDLLAALDRYESELLRSGTSQPDARALLAVTRRFIDWLSEGPSAAQARPSRPADGGGAPAAAHPETISELASAWIAAGRPSQRGIRWPRERWIAAFPEHADMFRRLPTLLDRQAVSAVAREAESGEDQAEAGFVTVMAWGYGSVGYGPFRTRRALNAQPDARARLHRVARVLERKGALAAYQALGSTSRLQGLGPSFGTKFLHFAQAPDARPRALILDETVASWLGEQGHRFNPNTWSARAYASYLDLIHEWADELGLAPDVTEYLIFRAMARRRGTQWAE